MIITVFSNLIWYVMDPSNLSGSNMLCDKTIFLPNWESTLKKVYLNEFWLDLDPTQLILFFRSCSFQSTLFCQFNENSYGCIFGPIKQGPCEIPFWYFAFLQYTPDICAVNNTQWDGQEWFAIEYDIKIRW